LFIFEARVRKTSSPSVGYARLVDLLGVKVFPLRRSARVSPVTRLTMHDDHLAVPSALAPDPQDLMGHLLFSLKHEGVNLSLLAQVLPLIPCDRFARELAASPNGVYIRKACFLREYYTGEEVPQVRPVLGGGAPLFDPQRYLVGPAVRNSRWRIDFNGLGSLDYCATVERTPAIERLLSDDILGRANEFFSGLPRSVFDRAVSWAYLHETRSSFAIEREAPSGSRAARFVALLQQAPEQVDLSEEYLVSLQNEVVTNPVLRAAAFRHTQNYLGNDRAGALGVTYVPPAPELCRDLMEGLMRFCNDAAGQVDPLVAGAVASFGFVFLHPFEDGNGRLSRFLIHHALCRSGALSNGLLLPVSAAMGRNENEYLDALQSFSKGARHFWDVTWIDGDDFDFAFTGHDALYRYWDATQCVEFTLRMAKEALERDIRQETLFLRRHDQIVRAVNAEYDVKGPVLSRLVMMCLENGGKVSKNRRKQYQHDLPSEAFDFIEEQWRECVGGESLAMDVLVTPDEDGPA